MTALDVAASGISSNVAAGKAVDLRAEAKSVGLSFTAEASMSIRVSRSPIRMVDRFFRALQLKRKLRETSALAAILETISTVFGLLAIQILAAFDALACKSQDVPVHRRLRLPFICASSPYFAGAP